jgi:hypothetical protein
MTLTLLNPDSSAVFWCLALAFLGAGDSPSTLLSLSEPESSLIMISSGLEPSTDNAGEARVCAARVDRLRLVIFFFFFKNDVQMTRVIGGFFSERINVIENHPASQPAGGRPSIYAATQPWRVPGCVYTSRFSCRDLGANSTGTLEEAQGGERNNLIDGYEIRIVTNHLTHA